MLELLDKPHRSADEEGLRWEKAENGSRRLLALLRKHHGEVGAQNEPRPVKAKPQLEPVEIDESVDPIKAWVERQKAIPLPKPRWFSVEKDLGPVAPRAIRMGDIIGAVSAHFNVSRHDILSSRRSGPVAHARQVAIFLCKMLTDHALTAIGRYMGRDHTTILYSVRKLERLVTIDHALAAEIEAIKQGLQQ